MARELECLLVCDTCGRLMGKLYRERADNQGVYVNYTIPDVVPSVCECDGHSKREAV